MDQNDIDSLMNGGAEPDGQDDAASNASSDGGESNDTGELSQADIDAALSGAAPPSPPPDDAPSPAFSEDTGFDQSDIDALMAGAATDAEPQPADPVPVSDAGSDGEGDGSGAGDVVLDSTGKPMDDFAAAMAAAIAEEQGADTDTQPAAELPIEDVQLPEFDQSELLSGATQPVSLLHDVELHVKIELGRTHMFVEDVLRLAEGSVVELDRLAGDPVDVYVNGRLVARGEVLVLNDNFCVRVSEIIADPNARLAG